MSEDKANEPAAEDRATDPYGDAQASESATPRDEASHNEGEKAPDAGIADPGETQMSQSAAPREADETSAGEGSDTATAAPQTPAPDAASGAESTSIPVESPAPAEGDAEETLLEGVTKTAAEAETPAAPEAPEEPSMPVEPQPPVEVEAEKGEKAGAVVEVEAEPGAETEVEEKAEEKAEAEAGLEAKVEEAEEKAEEKAEAEEEAEAKEPETVYYYPNKWARIILTSAEEVMGRQGVNAMLNMAKLPEYIGNYPPDNMKKAFSFEGVGQLQEAIWDFYGPRGARVFAVRAGEQAFLEGLAQFKSVAAAAQVAMRVGSLEAKVKLGLEFFSKFFNTVSDQVVEIDEDEKHWIWRITRCPVCWEREADDPVCHLAIGVLQAALGWTTEGKKFRVMETECKAKGDENCVIVIEKIPVE
jgi:predicted hydrocarbon binding protein